MKWRTPVRPSGIGEGPDTWKYRLRDTVLRPFWVFSPTWGLANVVKPKADKVRRAAMIRRLNRIYFLGSLGILGLTIALTGNDLAHIRFEKYGWWTAILHYILLWRFFEIAYAFLRDAFDKLEEPESSSGLRWGDRVMLAMRSYVELVSNFALIYALFPRSAWLATDVPRPPSTVTDLIWYSANVITTSGDGGYIPGNILLKLFSIGEVFCGVILLVVSFTIYTARALGGEPVEAESRQVAR